MAESPGDGSPIGPVTGPTGTRQALERILFRVCIAFAVLLYAAHFIHLRADFPDNSPWMDYSKYTDEGWYGYGAIRHALTGSWRLPGDFNPAAALPILPLLQALLFHVTGVSLVAARALGLVIFGSDLVLAFAALRAAGVRQTFAAGALLLLAGNAFLFLFSRLAILEPLLVFWTLGSWLLLLNLPSAGTRRRRTVLLLAAGFLQCLAVLTKTTAIFLFPAAACLVLAAAGFRWKRAVRWSVAVVLGGALPWCVYYLVVVRPHYLSDFGYLFSANEAFAHPTMLEHLWGLWFGLHGVLWIDPPLMLAAVAATLLAFAISAGFRRSGLVLASLFAVAGYVFFIGWHNSMQPRYYEVVAFPAILLLGIAVQALWDQPVRAVRWAACVLVPVCCWRFGYSTLLDGNTLAHPTYNLVSAAREITRVINGTPNHPRMLLSISGAEITLITHQPAICDDFGTWDLRYRIHQYQPGWYAAWNDLDPGTLEDLHTQYRLKQVAQYHVFDDEDRNLLVLYRLDPVPPNDYDAADEAAANAGK